MSHSMPGGKKRQLPLQTANLVVGFMIWVLLSSLLPFIKDDIPLSPGTAAWVVAVPVILGSLLRIPFGYITGRYGARIVYLTSFVALLFPVFFISEAKTAQDLIVGGIFLGIAGAIFSVGVTSLPRYYPVSQQGFVNGIYGIGNGGTAVTAFAAPGIALFLGWRTSMKLFLVILLVMIVLNLFFGDRRESKLATPIREQLKSVCRDYRLWLLSLFYFITFGTFVAFTMIMPDFLVSNYALEKVSAGLATGAFVVLAVCFRVAGGWLADRHSPYKLLMTVFIGMGIGAIVLTLAVALPLPLIGLTIIGLFCGMGNGVVFKLVPAMFPAEVGVASGFVAMLGGLGGFFPPLVLSFFLSAAGSYIPGFLLYVAAILGCVGVAFFLFKRETRKEQ